MGNLSSFRSVLVPLLEDVEQTDAFRQLFRNAIVDVHSAVFQRHADRAVLELGDTLGILTSTAKATSTNADLLSRLPGAGDVAPRRRLAGAAAASSRGASPSGTAGSTTPPGS